MPKRAIADRIRTALLEAEAIERKLAPFRISGRGHECRVVLNRSFAQIVRSCDLTRVHISGFGPKQRFPAPVFTRAAKQLAISGCPEAVVVLRQGFSVASV